MENSARNLLLNQRVSTESPFVSPDVWKSCGAAVLPFDDDCPVYAGLDLSARTDLTALVIVGEIDGAWHVVPHFWTPTQGLLDRGRRDLAPMTCGSTKAICAPHQARQWTMSMWRTTWRPSLMV